jgi:uncharacterized membrane protein YbhN (UPF0104 family)
MVVSTAVTLVVLAVVWPLQAALPGLGYGPGFVVRQTSFAISNAVPAGGAVGLGVQYGMLDSYGFGAGPAASAIAIVSVFNVFATLFMPVLGVVALLASGVVEDTYVLMAAIGILAVGVAVVAFTVVLRSEHGARTVGRWAERLVNPVTRRLAHGRSLDLTGKILDFRSSIVDVMQTRWVQVTLSTLLLQFTSWAILVLALRGLEAGSGNVMVTWTEALAAFSFARVASFIPITPGRRCRPRRPPHWLRRDQQPGPGRRPRLAGSDLRSPGAAGIPDLPLVAGHGRPPQAAHHPGQLETGDVRWSPPTPSLSSSRSFADASTSRFWRRSPAASAST